MTTDVDVALDVRGLDCPLPLLKAKQSLNRMNSGEVLQVLCNDPGSVRDFEVFAKQSGHALLDQLAADGEYTYWLRKR